MSVWEGIPLPDYSTYPAPRLIPQISDLSLSLATPIIVHWLSSAIFSFIEVFGYFEKYKLHTSAEEEARNRCTRWQCFKGVVLNQIIQTLLGFGLGMLGNGDMTGTDDYDIAVWARRIDIIRRAFISILPFIGIDPEGMTLAPQVNANSTEQKMIQPSGHGLSVDVLRFAVAIHVADTWHYFCHRWFHMNKWAYKKIHSIHHGLYVPYAFGSAFTHPLEGLLLDSVGVAISFYISGLSTRQGALLYGFTSFKVVMDHCGYVFPWDPMRLFTDNDANFHDIHHQEWGLKSHFAVYFSHWDRMMGTFWADKATAAALYERSRQTAQQKFQLKQAQKQKGKGSVTTEKL